MKNLLKILFYIIGLPIAFIVFGVAILLGKIYEKTEWNWCSILIGKVGNFFEFFSKLERKLKL